METLDNSEEFILDTNPIDADTDDDGMTDLEETGKMLGTKQTQESLTRMETG